MLQDKTNPWTALGWLTTGSSQDMEDDRGYLGPQHEPSPNADRGQLSQVPGNFRFLKVFRFLFDACSKANLFEVVKQQDWEMKFVVQRPSGSSFPPLQTCPEARCRN